MSSNITFVTHLRLDHQDRIDNLQTILNYYSLNYPEAKFIFIEDDSEHRKEFEQVKWPMGRTSFYFIPNDSFYYRTRALNYGIKRAKTPIVVSLDTDCIVPVDSFNKCVVSLLKDATIAWPYNGYFIDTSYALHQNFISSGYKYNTFFEKLPAISSLMMGNFYGDLSVRCDNKHHQGVGGIVMLNKERFLEIGGYNEKFICWGAEDNELFTRCDILNHKKFRDEDLNSICFHLFHKNAIRSVHPYYQSNCDELTKVEKMNKEELQNYIKTWKQYEGKT
jgi:predicted glycosyltransferase involved in capsule biosynthesis